MSPTYIPGVQPLKSNSSFFELSKKAVLLDQNYPEKALLFGCLSQLALILATQLILSSCKLAACFPNNLAPAVLSF